MNSPSKLKPALIGGVPLGLVSTLVGILMPVCCCLWAACAGFLAGFMGSRDYKNAGLPFGPGQGAILGLLAAVIFALVVGVLSTGYMMVAVDAEEFADEMQRQFDEAEDQWGEEVPAGMVDLFVNSGVLIVSLMMAGLNLIVALLFAPLGGLLAGVVFKNDVQPPGEATPGI